MRVGEFITSKSFVVLATFIIGAVIASQYPSPWKDGQLLELRPERPKGFTEKQSLIVWPEAPESDSEIFRLDFDLPAVESPSEHSPSDGVPTTAEAEKPSAVPPAVDAPPVFGPQDSEEALVYGPFRIGEDPRGRIVAEADPRDIALLTSLRQLREQLPQKSNHLEIPCRRAREYPDGSPILKTQDALNNGECQAGALDNFYASLRARAFKEPGLTRWMQYGDSLVVGDTLTGELRRLLQQQFGDGGHGFLYVGHPLRVFGYENIRVLATENWNVRTIVRHSPDGGDLFGLAGAEFRPTDQSSLVIQSARNTTIGTDLELFHLFYFSPPGVSNGNFRVSVNGDTHEERFETVPGSSGVHTLRIPRGEHRVSFSHFSPHLRYYGIVSETSGPGVVVDNVGQVSAREEHLLKINPDQWRDQLQLRDPDIVAFFYGVNAASSSGARIEERDSYADQYREVIRRATAGAPKRDCLVLSLLTRGTREGGKISPTSAVAVLNREQRRAALSSGCAFFDTTGLMGGPNGTRRWAEGRPALLGADLAHPTPTGYREIARRLYADLIDGFIDYMERRIAAGGER